MDIYFTEIETGWRIALSMLPEKARSKGDVKFQSYDFINVGEVKVPKGTNLLYFSWSGTLPGKSRKDMSCIKNQHWKSPEEIQSVWDKWRKNGTKIRLMITETSINHDVYLDKYSIEATGGCGDYDYDISFIEAKDVAIYTVNELNIKPIVKTNSSNSIMRPPPPAIAKKTYTVVRGDCLWSIAQRFLGKGNRYTEIYNLNKNLIDNRNKGTGLSRYTIYAGQVFTLP